MKRLFLTLILGTAALPRDLSAQVHAPADFGETVNGFQDDFTGEALGSGWAVRGDAVYSVSDGHLNIAPANGDPNHLLYELPGYNNTTQEVLTRMRVRNFGSGAYPRGGIAVGVSASSSRGINFTFRNDGSRKVALLNDFIAWGSAQSYEWRTNVWYWMRLRQEPNAASFGGTDDVFAKIWPADGSVPEPSSWQVKWNYTPTSATRTGYAGLQAGSETSAQGGLSEFDVDYVLIKASGLPSIVVSPSASVPIAAEIASQPQNAVAQELSPATFTVTAVGAPQPTFQWYKNDAPVPGATQPTHTQPACALSDDGALFKVVVANTVSNQAHSVTSRVATLTVEADLQGPSLTEASTMGLESVRLVLSERATRSSATNRANYTLSGPAGLVPVLDATLDDSLTRITLRVAPMSEGTAHTLVVNGVTDLSAAANTIATNTQVTLIPTRYLLCDIGSPQPASAVAGSTDSYTILAAGQDIGGTADQCHFSYQLVTGDFDQCVRIESLGLSDAWAKAGLIARETTNAGSRLAGMLATPSSVGAFFLARSVTDGSAAPAGSFPVNYPYMWLRLQRAGNLFTGYASIDGLKWSVTGSATLSLPDDLLVGLAVASHQSGKATQAVFGHITPTPPALSGTIDLPYEPLAACSRWTGLVLSEIMYHPAPRADGMNLEFVEIFNSSPFAENLGGHRLSGAIDFTFPTDTLLPAGAFLVIAQAPAALEAAYGIAGVLGPYAGSLPDDSGTLRLRSELDTVLLDVRYDSHAPWPCAADGAGHSLVLAHASFGEGDVRAWGSSDLVGGSPGRNESYRPSPLRAVCLNEILANAGASQDFVELFNGSEETLDVSGCILTDSPLANKFVIPPGTSLSPRGHRAFYQTELGFGLKAGGDTVYFKNPAADQILDAVRFEAQAQGVSLGRSPDGSALIDRLIAQTPGNPNTDCAIGDVVINEVMFNPLSGTNDDQYIELYNRSTNRIDLGGWKIAGGVGFTLPAGTTIHSNSYLVIARNATNLLAKYEHLSADRVLGNFGGSLPHSGARLALTMPQMNVTVDSGGLAQTNTLDVTVDEMIYSDADRKTKGSDGGGSSLELVEPRENHRLPANWADSDETAKSDWTTIEATGVLDWGMPGWDASKVSALLLGEGECLLDDIQVIADGRNWVPNGTFESGASEWKFEGNHERTSLEESGAESARSLHLRASGAGDAFANRVRTALTGSLPTGTTVTLRAKARWLCGCPEILLRLRGNWLEAAGSLSTPLHPGTPGARNSRSVANAGPFISGVVHSPALPCPGQPVVVSARIHDPDGLSGAALHYRIDPATTYSTVTLLDDGTGGDATPGDGVYSATIPGQQDGILVAFYIEASDGQAPAASATFPEETPAKESLVRFGEIVPFGSFGTYRLWMTKASFDRWSLRRTTSDEPIDCTFISGTRRVFYNVGAYYSGSPWKSAFSIIDTPTGNMCDYNIRFAGDDSLLGDTALKIVFPGNVDVNNQGIDQTAQMEPASFWIARQLGLKCGAQRYVHFFVNGVRRGYILYDMQIPNRRFIKGAYPDDEAGDLFEGSFWFEADSSDSSGSSYFDSFARMGLYTTADGTKKKARYRWNFPRHGMSGSSSDYTRWFALVDALNASADYTTAVDSLADVDQWMRIFAYEHMVNNWESFGFSHGVNMFFYKGLNGRWQLIPSDVDISFLGSPPDLFAVDDPALQKMIDHPPFRRAYWRALQDALNGPLQPAAIDTALNARYAALKANGIAAASPAAIKAYIGSLRVQIASQLATAAAVFTVDLASVSTVSQELIKVTGTAPFEVSTVGINGTRWPVIWTDVHTWSLELPVESGSNVVTFAGFDARDCAVADATATRTIIFDGTASEPPKVFINEWMASNTGAVRDPADNDADDWFELFNPKSTAVDLTGWFLSDSLTNRFLFPIPAGTLLPPYGYLLVWADDETSQNGAGQPDLHVNFKLDKAGEAIVLSSASGSIIDVVLFGQQTSNISQGRYPDGGPFSFSLNAPTPKGANVFSPPSPLLTAVERSGSDVTLRFLCTPGIPYQVQYKDCLADALWAPLGPSATATGTTVTVKDPAGILPARFYRLLLEP